MILEILIAQYKETEEVIKPMLDSIAIQQNINFDDINVIIANDGSDIILSDDFLNSYPFNITYLLSEHKGLSATRNFLLDNSSADYIMFCDADDMFLYNNALFFIFSTIKEKDFNCLFPTYTAEHKTADEKIFYRVESDFYVHGKVIRRQYLIDKNIRWNNNLKMYDSRYFLVLCEYLSEPNKILRPNYPYYLWKFNPNSFTRSTKDLELHTYNCFTLSVTCLTDELIKRGLPKKAGEIALNFIYLTYFIYNCENWRKQENQELVKEALKGFSIYYKKYFSLIDLVDEVKKRELIKTIRNQTVSRQKSVFLETITFPKWIEEIEQIEI